MSAANFSAYVVGAFLALHGLCSAQTTIPNSNTMGAPTSQAMDLRVGVTSPAESTDTSVEGRNRQVPSSQTLAVPVVSLGKDYRVGPNDLIDIEVLDLENFKRTVRVNAAGAISLPLIGRVVVAGLNSQEVEELIASRYAEKYLQNPQVSIFIKEFTTERLTIEGAIARPGIFPLTGQITLLRAIAMAGGFGPIADTSKVMLYRMNEQKVRQMMVYDIEKIRAGKSEDPPIMGDDLIVVQRDSTRVLLKDSLFRDVIDSINPFSVLVPR